MYLNLEDGYPSNIRSPLNFKYFKTELYDKITIKEILDFPLEDGGGGILKNCYFQIFWSEMGSLI